MIRRMKNRIWIWLLDHELVRVEPWRDPRRSSQDRALWRAAEPKRLMKGKVS